MGPASSPTAPSNQRSLFRSSNEDRKKREEATLRQMDEVTSKYMERMAKGSCFFFGEKTSGIVVPRFEPSEIVLETTIGMGEFGIVLKVADILLKDSNQIHSKHDGAETKPGTEDKDFGPASSDRSSLWLSSEEKNNGNVETDKFLRKKLAETYRRSDSQESSGTSSSSALSVSGNNYCDSFPLSQQASTSIELAPMSSRDTPDNTLLVIKQIRKDLYPKKQIEAAKDLAREAKLLARLQQLYSIEGRNAYRNNNHPNIICLRGIVSDPGTPQFGILLDRLHLTLTELSTFWKKRQGLILETLSTASARKRRGTSSVLSVARKIPDHVMGTVLGVSQKVGGFLIGQNHDSSTLCGKGAEASSAPKAPTTKRASREVLLLLGERILALWDVSEGMAHLHHRKILYRDLKTENVARTLRSKQVESDNSSRTTILQHFDHRNQQRMQIFDFGLAKECKPTDRISRYPIEKNGYFTDSAEAGSFYDNYKMTGMTGTMRIMAPEVIKCQAYGLPADVFSFGICMWEVFTGTKCNFLSAAEICDTKQTVRPELPVAFDISTERGSVGMPKKLQRLMQACWHEDPGKRPSFREIGKILRSSLSDLCQQSLGSQDVRRKTLPSQQGLPTSSPNPSFLSKGIERAKSGIAPLKSCVSGIGVGDLWNKIPKPQKQKQKQKQWQWHPAMDEGAETTDVLSDQASFWSRLEAIRASGLLDD